MKLKSIITIFIISLFYSCGAKKVAINKEEALKEVNSYVEKVDANKNLKTEVTEGALTDAEGFTDIGTFKYTVYFDEKSKELFKINNIEKTDDTINETYYFKDGKFVLVKFQSAKNGNSQISNGSLKEGKTESLNFYQDKAIRFQKAFKKSH